MRFAKSVFCVPSYCFAKSQSVRLEHCLSLVSVFFVEMYCPLAWRSVGMAHVLSGAHARSDVFVGAFDW